MAVRAEVKVVSSISSSTFGRPSLCSTHSGFPSPSLALPSRYISPVPRYNMPKTPTTKPKRQASPPSLPSKATNSSSTRVEKETIIQILLAKLGDNRSFDWYELSQKLNIPASGGKPKGKGKGKAKEEEGMSGTELRDVYTDTILPAIRKGVMPWEDTSDNSSSPAMTPGSSSSDDPPLNQGRPKREAKAKNAKARQKKAIEEENSSEDGVESEYEEEELL